MEKIRIDYCHNFTVISNIALNDPRLSLSDKGLYSLLSSYPGNNSFILSDLAEFASDSKKEFIESAVHLAFYGYLSLLHDDDTKEIQFILIDAPDAQICNHTAMKNIELIHSLVDDNS